MDRTKYDTKKAFEVCLKSYAEFYYLMRARKEAAERKEELHEFYVKGRFYADKYGRWYVFQLRNISDEEVRRLPTVMTAEEFMEYLGKIKTSANVMVFEDKPCESEELPPPLITCARCGKANWTIEDCFYAVTERKDEVLSLEPFAGMTIAQIQQKLNLGKNAVYIVRLCVQNDKWKDSSPSATQDRKLGWRNDKDTDIKITPQYVAQKSDWIMVVFGSFYHLDCWGQVKFEREEPAGNEERLGAFTTLLSAAGFQGIVVEPTDVPELFMSLMMYFTDNDKEKSIALMENQPYYKVSTVQGVFGVLIWLTGAIVNLSGTGLGCGDVSREYKEVTDELLPLPATDGDNYQALVRLRRLLIKIGTIRDPRVVFTAGGKKNVPSA